MFILLKLDKIEYMYIIKFIFFIYDLNKEFKVFYNFRKCI